MNCIRECGAEPIAGYRLIEPLGSGGFGEVWKCEAPGGILKAIKFVIGNLNNSDEDSAKAEQEARALERVKLIRHPFVISMDLIKVVNGELLIVMELADKSLHDVFEEYKAEGRPGIPRDMLLGFMSDASEGLDHMIEKHQLQHLDVKPKNLFLIADRVKVADFGLVRAVGRASSVGMAGGITPIYAAPESFANKVSKHSDQYSLAVVYTELVSGRKPFNGKNIRQLAMQHMMEPPDLSGVPNCDRAAVQKALSKNPDERFPNCNAFVRALIGGGDDPATTLSMPGGSRMISFAEMTSQTRFPDPNARLSGERTGFSNPSGVSTPTRNRSGIRNKPGSAPTAAAARRTSSAAFIEPDSGILRPAILIGVGSFGRRALQQIRCRMLDRIGQLTQVPCHRYLYLDCDPDASEKVAAAGGDAQLTGEQQFPIPLQAVTNYRRRQLDDLVQWLPREKLYSMPRSLRVDGSRALGRLAFCDHYLRFLNRMKHEIGACTNPESLHQSQAFTGLPIKTKTPAVYIFISASGGTSGMLLDLGHAIRRALEKMNLPNTPVSAFILTGAATDPDSPPQELANVFATLTELNHYADPDVSFNARYGGPEGPQADGRGLPFSATYLLPMSSRTPEAFRDATAHLAGYILYDLTTPLGTGLDQLRKAPTAPGRSPFRGFGTFGVWYPRGLILRSSARQAVIDLARNWCTMQRAMPPQAEDVLNSILTDTRLTPEPIKQFIASKSGTKQDPDPLESLARWVQDMVQQSSNPPKNQDSTTWAVGAWDTARDWLGLEPTSANDSAFRRGRLSKTLDAGLVKACDAWNSQLAAKMVEMETLPGPRLGATQIVLERLLETAAGAVGTVEGQFGSLAVRRENAKVGIQEALASLQSGGGFSLFGSKTGKALKTFAEKLKAFVDLRVVEDLTLVASQFYRKLHAKFEEYHREVASARDRLSKLCDYLEAPLVLSAGSAQNNHTPVNAEDATQTSLRGSNTMRIVLPKGQDHLDRSAAEMLEALPPDSVATLEKILTKVVLQPRGGLVELCNSTADPMINLANPMIDQATDFLTELLPVEDVTAVEHSAAREDLNELGKRIGSYIRGAAPLAPGPAEEERTFVVHPDTPPGRAYAEVVQQVAPYACTVPVAGIGTDLLFCREQGALRMSDVQRLIDPCWDAYEQLSENILLNPHSRFDVSEWFPLVQ